MYIYLHFFLSNINLTFLNSQWHSRLKKTLQEPRRKTNNHGHIHTVVTYGRTCFFFSLDISTGSNQIGVFETNIFAKFIITIRDKTYLLTQGDIKSRY